MIKLHEVFRTLTVTEETAAHPTPHIDAALEELHTPVTHAVLAELEERASEDRADMATLRSISRGEDHFSKYELFMPTRADRIRALYMRLDVLDRQKLGLKQCRCGSIKRNPCDPVD